MESNYEYRLICALHPEGLSDLINQMGRDDWEPFMNSYVSTDRDGCNTGYYQMMCRVKTPALVAPQTMTAEQYKQVEQPLRMHFEKQPKRRGYETWPNSLNRES